jgi:hypothetical protein
MAIPLDILRENILPRSGDPAALALSRAACVRMWSARACREFVEAYTYDFPPGIHYVLNYAVATDDVDMCTVVIDHCNADGEPPGEYLFLDEAARSARAAGSTRVFDMLLVLTGATAQV